MQGYPEGPRATEIRQKALALVRRQSTEQLVQSFGLTDTLMRSGLTEADYLAVAESRGWMMLVLEERGELERVLAA